jgi:hypothetical protein
LVAAAGPGVVFLLNGASFVVVCVAVARWRPSTVATSKLPPEHILSATRTGLRYSVNAPEFAAVLVRAIAYVAAFSAIPALFAIVTRTRLGGSAADFGILLGIAGVGGLTSAFFLPRLWTRFTVDRLIIVATALYALTLLAVGSSQSVRQLAPVMFVGGFAQMTVMSSLSVSAQQVLPAWVRGRGLAVFMLTFQLGIAGGAAVWGAVAASIGSDRAMQIAAIAMASTIALAWPFPLPTERPDLTNAYHAVDYAPVWVEANDGPVLVTTEYVVATEDRSEFLAIMRSLRQMRRREGALRWELFEDAERRGTQVETFMIMSWIEHRRQADRRTGQDDQVLRQAAAYHRGSDPPRSRYLVGHRVRNRHWHFTSDSQPHTTPTERTAGVEPSPTTIGRTV